MAAASRVRVWDLPTRLFHWLLALVFGFSWLTGQFGGSDWREWHFMSGYAALALLLFRLAWGFAGPRYARFASFVPRWPRREEWFAPQPPGGHSAPGALSIYAMLGSFLVQVVTGGFSSDESYSEGPWARFVSNAVVETMTRIHTLNRWLLAALVLVHIAVILWYEARRDPLIGAMLHGDRATAAPAAADDWRIRLRAAVLVAAAIALTAWLVTL